MAALTAICFESYAALFSIDLTTQTRVTNTSAAQITITNAGITNKYYTTLNTNGLVIGDPLNVAFQKVNSNFTTVQAYMTTNGSGGSGTATNLSGYALQQSTNIAAYQAYLATNNLVLTNLSASTTNLSGNALVQSTNIAAYQAYLATNALNLSGLSGTATNLSGNALVQSTNIAAYQALLATNGLGSGAFYPVSSSITNTLTNNWISGPLYLDVTNSFTNRYGGKLTILGTSVQEGAVGTSASGFASHAEGGNSIASGNYSHAAGANASATNNNTYVWSDGAYVGSTTNNQYSVYADNGIRLLGGAISGNGSGLTNINATNNGLATTNYVYNTITNFNYISNSQSSVYFGNQSLNYTGATLNVSSVGAPALSVNTGNKFGTALQVQFAALAGFGGFAQVWSNTSLISPFPLRLASLDSSGNFWAKTLAGTLSSTNITGLGTAAYSNSTAFASSGVTNLTSSQIATIATAITNGQIGANLGYTVFTNSIYRSYFGGEINYYASAAFPSLNYFLGNTNYPEAQNTNMGIVFAPVIDNDRYLGATNSLGNIPRFFKFWWQYVPDVTYDTNVTGVPPNITTLFKISKDLTDNGNDYVQAYNDLVVGRDLRVERTNYASAFIGTNLIITGYSNNLISTYINEIGSYVIDGSSSEGYDVILTNLNLRIDDNFTIYANGFGLKHIPATNLDGIGTAAYSNATAFALSGVTNLTANQLLIISSALTNANAFDTNGSSAAIKTAILNSNYVTMAITNGLATTNYVKNSTNNLPSGIWTLGTASQSNSTAFALSSVTNLTANQLTIINSALTNANAYDTNGAALEVKTTILNSNYVTASITNGLPSAIWTLGTASQSNANAFALSSITNLTPGQIGTISLALTNAYATNASGVIINGNKVFISTNYAGIGVTNLTGGQLQVITDSITNNFTGTRVLIDTNNLATNILGGSVVQIGNSLLAGFNSTNQTFPIWTNASSFTFTNSNFILGNSCIAYKNSAFSIAEGYQSWASGSFGVAMGFRSRIGDPTFSGVTGGVAIGYNVGTYNDYGVAMGQAVSNTMASSFAWHDGFSSTYNAHAIQSFNVMAHGGIYLEGGTIYGNGNGISNIPSTSITGGVTTNLQFTFNATRTNTLYFTNGILMKVTQP